MPRLPDDTLIHIRALGRDVRVTAVFTDDATANAYMAQRPNEGVVAEVASLVFIANIHDRGKPVEPS